VYVFVRTGYRNSLRNNYAEAPIADEDDSFDDDVEDGSCVALYDFIGQYHTCSLCWISRLFFM